MRPMSGKQTGVRSALAIVLLVGLWVIGPGVASSSSKGSCAGTERAGEWRLYGHDY